MPAFVYIMASKRNGTLHIGSTTDLAQRAYQHREGAVPGFTQDYRCQRLVWFEGLEQLADAQLCERRMKKWNRAWKLKRIEERNPLWRDLYDELASHV